MADLSLRDVFSEVASSFSSCSETGKILHRLCFHPVVLKFTGVFNNRLLSRIAQHAQEPNAVNWHTQYGDFILEGLRPMLVSALNKQRLSLEVVCGSILLDDRFAIATIHVPETSEYGTEARHGLFNTNVLFEGGRFVATPYRALEGYICPASVHGDSPAPAFELSDGESLAVEAGLVFKSVFAAYDNAFATRKENRFDAFSANVRDMIGIIEYIKSLIVRLDTFNSNQSTIESVHTPVLTSSNH